MDRLRTIVTIPDAISPEHHVHRDSRRFRSGKDLLHFCFVARIFFFLSLYLGSLEDA